MQQHMFWALFIHAQDAQDVRDDRSKAGGRLGGPEEPARSSSGRRRGQRGQTALRHVPPLEETLIDYYTRGAYDEYWNRIEHDYTQLLGPARRHPGHVLDRLVRPVPGRRHRVLRRDGREEQRAPAARRSARGATSACAATQRSATTSTSGLQSVWGVQRYFEEQLDFFERWLPDDATGQPAGEAPVRIFVMGGGSGRQDGRRASSTTAAAGATSRSGRSPAARRTAYYLHGDGSLSTRSPPRGRGAAPLHRSTRRIRCRPSAASTARSASCPPTGRGWSRPGRGS